MFSELAALNVLIGVGVTLAVIALVAIAVGVIIMKRRRPQPVELPTPATPAAPAPATSTAPPTPRVTPAVVSTATPSLVGNPCDSRNMPTGGFVFEMDGDTLRWFREFGSTGGTRWSPTGEVNITVAELAAELCRSDADRNKVALQAEIVGSVKASVERVIRQDKEIADKQVRTAKDVQEVNNLLVKMRGGPTAPATATQTVTEPPTVSVATQAAPIAAAPAADADTQALRDVMAEAERV